MHKRLLTFLFIHDSLPLIQMRRGLNSTNRQEKYQSSAKLKQKESATGITINTTQQVTTSTMNNQANFNLEEMITYIRGNLEVAFSIHQQLNQFAIPPLIGYQHKISTSQTSKRNLDSSDNDARPTSKQRHMVTNDKQKNIAHENDSIAINIAPGSNRNPLHGLLLVSEH